MPYIKPQPSPFKTLTFRIAATAWLRHLRCRVRRCRRNGRCMGEAFLAGVPQCVRDMPSAEVNAMLTFFVDTAELATPESVAESLARATMEEEREMIAFRRRIFLSYHDELAKAGLAEPLGPPFVEAEAISP
ncbi:MAG TPA: hypothetical protein VL202_14635 [Pararhizobium sp.]|uniref:hypothetical protein n=1 Tax=Pararhizobium sp. TaxID=1977563 RepID=UPI002BCFC42A|nr:hypothetical protein [Pararhizobium sp.]HTO32391.1 hypothetical protein [Pararhizobium sp.]